MTSTSYTQSGYDMEQPVEPEAAAQEAESAAKSEQQVVFTASHGHQLRSENLRICSTDLLGESYLASYSGFPGKLTSERGAGRPPAGAPPTSSCSKNEDEAWSPDKAREMMNSADKLLDVLVNASSDQRNGRPAKIE